MIMEIINTVAMLWLMYVCEKCINHLWNMRSFPPGPFPLPVIGNMHSILNQHLHLWVTDMVKQCFAIEHQLWNRAYRNHKCNQSST